MYAKGKSTLAIFCLAVAVLVVTLSFTSAYADQIDILGPAGSGSFGTSVAVLPNGNIVVTDPTYDLRLPTVPNVGAVYLYNGITGALISVMTGSTANDRVGNNGVTVLANGNYVVVSALWTGVTGGVGAVTWCSGATGCSGIVSQANSLVGSTASNGITALTNGNYVVSSSDWNGAAAHVGAVTWCNGTTGCAGMLVSAANSLVGSRLDDHVGSNTMALTNGNYVVSSPDRDGAMGNVGAVTWCDGTTGCSGVVSSSNSLVGSAGGDQVGMSGVIELTNGNYVVPSPFWGGQPADVGAVTLCSGTAGCSGVISSANSLIGSHPADQVGVVTPLTNGNYVVRSERWDGSAVDVGAVTWCSGTTGCSGVVSSANSLVGSTTGDQVGGGGVTALTNGNYVVRSSDWDGSAANVGAVTWCSGTTGRSGAISSANSLVGSRLDDQVGSIGTSGVSALANGNYVVASSGWDGPATDVGAVTWCSGTTGRSGVVSSGNSLVGYSAGDHVGGGGVTALTNGNYVVASLDWNGTAPNVGAATWCSGTTGCFDTVVSVANSLVGSTVNDLVGGGGGGVTALTNGNYVVASPSWTGTAADIGAVTWCGGTTGCSGVVSLSNSLVGSTSADSVGNNGIAALTNGNYVVRSNSWNGTAMDVGAVTWCSGTTGCPGLVVSAANSLVGSTANDSVGSTSITALTNGNYIVRSDNWDNPAGPVVNARAVSYGKGNGGTVGPISADNSVRGTVANGISDFTFNYATNSLVVGRAPSNIVSVLRLSSIRTRFDFDGDHKADLSVFRPSVGQWYYQESGTNTTRGFGFGSSTDRIATADFTGDGKTDIAFWRPSTDEWYVLRSEDSTFYAFPFGASGDIPAPADYDGDGRADATVYRPAAQTWFILRSTGGVLSVPFGLPNDIPVPADYDGDGKADVGIYRPDLGQWWNLRSSNGSVFAATFGSSTDKPVAGDYTGDGKADVAFYRPAEGSWYVLRSEDFTYYAFPFGNSTDKPAPADFDGDGRFDAAVFRPSDTNWYILKSTGGLYIQQFGAANDIPLPGAFVP